MKQENIYGIGMATRCNALSASRSVRIRDKLYRGAKENNIKSKVAKSIKP